MKKIKQFFQTIHGHISKFKYRKKLRFLMESLRDLDILMTKAGYNRQQRRQFWRDFVKKNRTNLVREMHGKVK